MRGRQTGFTLIEAVIAMAVMGILAALAVPAMDGAFEATNNAAAKSSLYETWTGAVRHAVVTGSDIVVCPGDAGGCRGGIDWSPGWIAFADLDGNRSRSPNETLLSHVGPLAGKVHLRSTAGRTRLVLQGNGRNAGSNVTFTLCDGRGPGKAGTVVLANDGRMRMGTPSPAAAQACMAPV